MNHLNSILLEGELVRNPQYSLDKEGGPACSFSLASKRYFKNQSGFETETSYFDIETTGKLASQCKEQGREGRGIRVVGRLKQEHGLNAEGKPVFRILVVAEHVEFRPSMTQGQKQTIQNDEDYALGR
jgi:single-strand DNA-binding protein